MQKILIPLSGRSSLDHRGRQSSSLAVSSVIVLVLANDGLLSVLTRNVVESQNHLLSRSDISMPPGTYDIAYNVMGFQKIHADHENTDFRKIRLNLIYFPCSGAERLPCRCFVGNASLRVGSVRRPLSFSVR